MALKYIERWGISLAYGRGPRSLAEQLGVSVDEAKNLIAKYFRSYSGIQIWLERAGHSAIRNRSCRTINNRIRYFESDPNAKIQRSILLGNIEREGKNTPIQGSSADMTKLAMWYVHNALKPYGITDIHREGPRSMMVNTIHDELVGETPPGDAEQVGHIIRAEMERAGSYFMKNVPIAADMGVCDSWAEK